MPRRVELVRADIGQLAKAAVREMISHKAQTRKMELSGDIRQTMQGNAPTIAVVQRIEPPAWNDPMQRARVSWTSLAQPWNLPELHVVGHEGEAAANKWTLFELLERRMHRKIRDGLMAQGTVTKQEANRVAKLCKVYIAEARLFAAEPDVVTGGA